MSNCSGRVTRRTFDEERDFCDFVRMNNIDLVSLGVGAITVRRSFLTLGNPLL